MCLNMVVFSKGKYANTECKVWNSRTGTVICGDILPTHNRSIFCYLYIYITNVLFHSVH